MAKDIPDNIIQEKTSSRVAWDYTFLSPSSLPYFLADKMKAAWRGSWPDIEITTHSPDQNVASPGITWKIHRRVPGKDSKNSLKAEWLYDTVREETKDVVSIYRQYQTVTYEFVIHSRDGYELHVITDEFENLMLSLVPDLQARGVENFLFEEEVRSGLIDGGRQQEIPKRTLRYTAYLQKTFSLALALLDSVDLESRAGPIEQEDITVFRSRKEPYDILDINPGPFALTCVANIPLDDLMGEIRIATVTGGADGLKAISTEHIYIKEKDYIVGEVESLKTGTKLPAIMWLDKPGSKSPQVGTAYYLSLKTSKVILNTKITRPEEQ